MYEFEPDDYSVVIKNTSKYPKPWRWRIYRAGRDTPVDQSAGNFETMTVAYRDGKEALRMFLAKRFASPCKSNT